MVGARGGESVLHGDRVSVWGDGKFCWLVAGAAARLRAWACGRCAVRSVVVKMVFGEFYLLFKKKKKAHEVTDIHHETSVTVVLTVRM